MEPERRRSRLSPEARRGQLLQVAAAMVVDEDLHRLTMERLAARACVSKALVYQYFGSRAGLLLELYKRESDAQPLDVRVAGCDTFEERLRAVTRPYFDAVEHRGLLFHRIVGEKSVEAEVEAYRRSIRSEVLRYWVDQLVDEGLDEAAARVFASMFQAAVEAAGGLVARGAVERSVAEAQFYRATLAAFEAARGGSGG